MKARRGSTEPLDEEERTIIEKYVSFLDDVPGPVTVWVTTDGGLLHFHTLVSSDDKAENAVYKAERKLLRAIDPLVVDFDVHRRTEYVHQILFKDQAPVYQHT